MAGPGELAVVVLRGYPDGRRLQGVLPEARNTIGGAVALGRPALADIDDAPLETVRSRRAEPALVSAGQGVSAREAVAEPSGQRLLQDRSLDAANVAQKRAGLERGGQLLDEIQSWTGRHRENHELGAAHRTEWRVGQIGDGRGLKRLDAFGSLGRIADHTLDARQAGLFQVEGLTRVFGKVNLLKGSLHLTQVRDAFDQPNGVYIATGPFQFQLYDSQARPAAALHGMAAVDFEARGNAVYLAADEGAARSRSREFAFEGTWTDTHSPQAHRVLWASEFPPVGQQVLGDFDLGGRMATINPKYKQYGWDGYYQQDEWWVTSQTPFLTHSYPNRILP